MIVVEDGVFLAVDGVDLLLFNDDTVGLFGLVDPALS